VLGLLLAEFAELLELDLALDKLAILARPVVDVLALLARKFDELILGHGEDYTRKHESAQSIICHRGR
jgi:hypothetical protein